ncbi:MAG: hypothetical protein EBU84_02825 [Actinobacteria bacterium]|nr:hypothetical protein [Actinomycetota bacterium]
MPLSKKITIRTSLFAALAFIFCAVSMNPQSPVLAVTNKTQIKFKFAPSTSAEFVMVVGPSAVQKIRIRKGADQTIILGTSMQGTVRRVVDGRPVLRPDGVFRVSLHLVDSDGKYVGPVNFKTTSMSGGKNKWSTNVLPTAKALTNLGTITQRNGYGVSGITLAARNFGKFTNVKSLTTGEPTGAGTLGLKSRVRANPASIRDLAVTCRDEIDDDLGGDCDLDGVVNAVDPDDDGDAILDLADKSTARFDSQKYLPWSTLYLDLGGTGSQKTLNANIDSVSKADIELAIGADNGSFATAFYLNLPPGTADDYDAAWIDCGDLSYCNSSTGTATTGPPSGQLTSVFNRLWCTAENSAGGCESTVLWRDYTGTIVGNPNNAGSADNFAVEAGDDPVANGLTYSEMNGSGVWAGSMRPNVDPIGTGVLESFRFGDPYVLKLRNKTSGEITSVPMSLGAYFITVPAVKSANGVAVDYASGTPLGTESNPIQVNSDGTFSLEFWRPQRQAVAGVDYADDGSSDLRLMDLGGLRYGLIMGTHVDYRPSALVGSYAGSEVGCTSKESAGIYSDLPTNLARTFDENLENPQYDKNLWPLTDRGADGPSSDGRDLGFTFDMKKCIEYLEERATHSNYENTATLDTSTTRKIPIQLTAVGIDLTGGASRAAQTFWVELPEDRSGW